ncbi:hypothetical protein E0493_00235 [Roseomonas sp. M0104]|uniref:Uncharacterized protein n=1 Tax=Teichococcus coralli TaxID=2545983 RepID=A0A845B559_9PROT|nr:hypothetical protein [Pseudoroseomonas coralli]MXP61775.1 hypothetical protein [Pseudoroseomonas coralli]
MRNTHAAEIIDRHRGVRDKPEQPYIRAGIVALLSAVVMVVLAVLEKRAYGSWGFADEPPAFDAASLAKSALALLLSALFILPFLRSPPARALLAMGVAEKGLAWASLALAVAFLAVFLASPELFSALAREDHSVEWGSALALFLGCGLLLWSAVRFIAGRRNSGGYSASLCGLGALLLAACLFVVGMEEISWMQRVFDIHTPEALIGTNMQEELNFHNLFTNGSELLYYGGSFVFLMLLPFLKEMAPVPAVLRAVGPLIPGRAVLAVSAPIATFNFDMWHLLPIQMVLILSLVIVVQAARTAPNRGEATLFSAIAAMLALSQLLLIAFGDHLVRLWDPTEYKELFIGLGFACYGGQVAWHAARSSVPASRRLRA